MHSKTSGESEWKITRADMFNMPREERIGARLTVGDQILYVLRVGPPLYDEIDFSPLPKPEVDFEIRPIFLAGPTGDIELARGLADVMEIVDKSGLKSLEFIRAHFREFCRFVAAHLNRGSLYEGSEDLIRELYRAECEQMLPVVDESGLAFWTYDDRLDPPRLLEHRLGFAGWDLQAGRERFLHAG